MLPHRGRTDLTASKQKIHDAVYKWVSADDSIDALSKHDDWTVLQLSCAVGDRAAIAFAMEHGADVNDCSASRVLPRCTPLHILARYDMFDLIDCLPGRTDFNKQDQWGFTALHYAVAACSVRSARVLLERGANVLIRSHRGATPVDIATALDNKELITLLAAKFSIESDPTFDQFKNWLSHLGAGEYVNAFVSAGYDLPFIQKHGLNDADLNCVTIPEAKLGLRKKLMALHQLEKFAELLDGDIPSEDDSDGESGSETESGSDS